MAYSIIISAILSYLLGSINTSIIISKLLGHDDIRQKGSGNAGATNTLRVMGKKAAVLVVIGDALKGILAVLFSKIISQHLFSLSNHSYSVYTAAVFVVIGHLYPVYFGFKGGKGIMTSIAVIFVLDWHIGLILLGLFIVLLICFNYVSLASCLCALVYPILVLWMYRGDAAFLISSVIVALLAIFKHRTNIVRLLNGTESKLFKNK